MVETLQPQGLAILILSISLSTFVVILRLYSRYLGKAFGYDDALIIVALICAIAHSILTYIYVVRSYVGYHTKDIPLSTLEPNYFIKTLQINVARVIFYASVFAFARASAIVFLLRLEEYRERIRKWLKILLVLNFMNSTAIVLADIFACQPLHFLWDYPKMIRFENGQWILDGKCLNFEALGIASTAITIALDILVLITPMAMVWKLRMSKSNKVIAVLVLSVGWLATLASIGQLIVYIGTFNATPTSDGSYSVGWTLSNAEVNIAIIAASVPALKALYKRISIGKSNNSAHFPSSPMRHGSVSTIHELSFPQSWDPTGAIRDDIAGRRRGIGVGPGTRRPQRDSIYDEVHFAEEHKESEFELREANESQERIVSVYLERHKREQRDCSREIDLEQVAGSPTSMTSVGVAF